MRERIADTAELPVPRPEHPRPQLERESWLCLNGPWRFAFDFGRSGLERFLWNDPSPLDQEILVPFCPESRLSGIGHTDFIPEVWYARSFRVPDAWQGMRVRLHFGGVDYACSAWVNGLRVGYHEGGMASFCFDVTDALRPGENQLVVQACDDTRSGVQPLGKQSVRRDSFGAWYTRVTGIWQSVWLEAVAEVHLDGLQILPDLARGGFVLVPRIAGGERGLVLRATILQDGCERGSAEGPARSGAPLFIEAPGSHLWSPADPHLYDLRLELEQEGRVVDCVRSYAGLREIGIEGNRFVLNGEPLFLRLVLDQGYYPDGIWTAPDDAALRRDIELGQALGMNGARLHQKVFEERYHYWADRLGYLTWGEFGDWGIDGLQFFPPVGDASRLRQGFDAHLQEWLSVVERDRNHPSIITWTPFNETQRREGRERIHDGAIARAVALTRALDPSRPVHDASGFSHVETDVFSAHDYEQDVETFRKTFSVVTPDAREVPGSTPECPYAGQPYVVDEYGGTWWTETAETDEEAGSWGYGKRPESVEEVLARIEGLTGVLTDHPQIAGFCYTQLTDVEQEKNGLYLDTREPKLDAARLRACFAAPAAIEKDGA